MNCATSMLSTVIAGSSAPVMSKFCCLAPSSFRRHADTPWVRQPVISACEVRVHQYGRFEIRHAEVRAAEVRPAEARLSEVRTGERRPAEVRPVEVRPWEARLADARVDEVCPAEVRPAEVRPAEVRPGKVPLAEIRPGESLGEVRIAKICKEVGVLVTPCVPGVHTLLENRDVLVVRHRSTPA